MMGATVLWSTISGQLLSRLVHYKRVPYVGTAAGFASLVALTVFPATLPMWLVLTLLFVVGSGLGTVFPISTVCMQNAVARSQMGIATGAANFFRALFSSLIVAVLGAIVLGHLGGASGGGVEDLARAASADVLTQAFRAVFATCALVLCIGFALLIALEERPLRGPTPPSEGAIAPTGPATPIPDEGFGSLH